MGEPAIPLKDPESRPGAENDSGLDLLKASDEQLGENQQPSCDRNDSINSNGAVARRPGKHQDTVQRHELLGPNQPSQAEDQVRLHDQAEDQIKIEFVHRVIPGETLNFITLPMGSGNGIRTFSVTKGFKTGGGNGTRESGPTC